MGSPAEFVCPPLLHLFFCPCLCLFSIFPVCITPLSLSLSLSLSTSGSSFAVLAPALLSLIVSVMLVFHLPGLPFLCLQMSPLFAQCTSLLDPLLGN